MPYTEIETRSESVSREKSYLVGVLDSRSGRDPHEETDAPSGADFLEELFQLAQAAGTEVVGELTQRLQHPDAATYIGRGKVEELRAMVEKTGADVVIFDNDLVSGQIRNLEKALNVKVIDRTELILDIFASRAQTRESRLAVELAQLEYSLPRLKRLWTHLSRQKNSIGLRGPGEKQLEVDRRLAQKRISDLKIELRDVQQRKQREVASRRGTKTVSLVGYTNAGKSTLMNAMTGADVFVKDQLFATLDTRTRRWQLPGWGPVLLSDTVGFIRKLPHHLVASFRATLEEARNADLLLHVADGSNPDVEGQIAAAYQVLEELGIQEKDTILVINKIDRYSLDYQQHKGESGVLTPQQRLGALLNRYPNAVGISALSGAGLESLAEAVSGMLSRNFPNVDVEMGAENGRVMAYLADKGEVFSRQYLDSGRVILHCRISQSHLGRLKGEHDVTITEHREP